MDNLQLLKNVKNQIPEVFCGIYFDLKWRGKLIVLPKDKAAKKMKSKIVLNHATTHSMLNTCSLLLIRQITILISGLTGIFNQFRISKSQKTTALGALSAPPEQ